MKKVIHLTSEEVLEIHKLLIAEFGGQNGLRDRGLLESALFRPQSGYYDNIFEQAAALLESLCTNHPFVDGNKRIAWTVTKTFLLVNGQHLKAHADEAENFLIQQVIKNKMDLPVICKWIKDRCSSV